MFIAEVITPHPERVFILNEYEIADSLVQVCNVQQYMGFDQEDNKHAISIHGAEQTNARRNLEYLLNDVEYKRLSEEYFFDDSSHEDYRKLMYSNVDYGLQREHIN